MKLIESSEDMNMEEWDINNPNITKVGLYVNAALRYVLSNIDAEQKSNEDIDRIEQIKVQLESDDISDSDKVSLEEELEELESKVNVYDFTEDGDYYDMIRFKFNSPNHEDMEIAVGTESEINDSAIEYTKQLIEDNGLEGFKRNFIEQYLDTDAIVNRVMEIIEDDIYYSPESYLSESDRDLSAEQEEDVEILNEKIIDLQSIITALTNKIEETTDDNLIDKYNNRIGKVQDIIDGLNNQKDEIIDSPEGYYKDELIQRAIAGRREDVERNTEYYVDDFNLDIKDFIDMDALVEGVVETDGYGIVASYDGDYDVYNVNGIDLYVVRID